MPSTAGRIYLGETLVSSGTPASTPWVRNPSWPACDAPSGSNKIVGLYAVYPGDGVGNGGNFFAVTIAGDYTINYGDGTTTNYTSGSTAYYEFNYSDADLAGTDAPVTLTDAGDLVARTAHGYTNGMTVRFYNIVTTTGLTAGTPYYVINATANTFQVSATPGGSAVSLTNDGTATLLPYKIATVTITPQSGSDLTSVNFFVKHNQAGLVSGYSTGWLDIAIAAPSCTALTIGSNLTTVRHSLLERVRLNQLGSITSFSRLFQLCRAIQSVEIEASTTNVTNTSGMFLNCVSLKSVPFFNTASVTNMAGMFAGCSSIATVPLFNTSAVTSMGQLDSFAAMFSNCSNLTSVPLFNTSSVTDMQYMFSNCVNLESIPLFSTSAVTNMGNMFLGCNALASVPAITTTAALSFTNMFNNCNSLARIQAKDFRFTFSVANCKLSAAALDEIYTNLPTVTGQTITVTGNYGTASDNPSIATAKGWTVTG